MALEKAWVSPHVLGVPGSAPFRQAQTLIRASAKSCPGGTPDALLAPMENDRHVTAIDPVVERMVAFLGTIGLPVSLDRIGERTVVPGILIDRGVIVVDESQLAYPGDLLHEAGHLAVMPAARRGQIHCDAGNEPAEEMAAIGWSYAAALHIGLDPAVVFHEAGYRGGSQSLLENFAAGRYLGVPMLQWLGLAEDLRTATANGRRPYPEMLRWVADR